MSLPESAPEAIAPIAVSDQTGIAASDTRKGVIAALGAYVLWGFLPLLFRLLDEVGSTMIVAERTIWCLLLLAIVLAFKRRFGQVRALLTDWPKMRIMAISSVLLGGNWLLYIWAVETGQLLEASFGYFINPLVNIAMGMVLLGERQNFLQKIAIGIAVVAIGIQAIGLGGVPYIALGLAISFALYGYFRKTAMVGPTTGLFIETLIIAPIAIVYVGYNIVTAGVGPLADPGMLALSMLTGPATAVPLLLFAVAVQNLRLTTIGMFQYLSPTIQFLLAITVFGEQLNGTRLLSFGLIWVSLMVFSYDSFRRRSRAATV